MDKFKVKSKEEFELFKLLTPSVIVLLKKIEKRHSGFIQYCFFGDQLHVSINDGNKNFKVSLLKKLEKIYIKDIVYEIDFLKQFMDDLEQKGEQIDRIKGSVS